MKYSKMFYLTHAAVIAALYVVFTMLANAMGLANHVIQIRFSEALTILPYFSSAAIPGLFIGCLLSNLLTGSAVWDVILGSFATLIGAVGTRLLRKNKWLAPVCPILSNTFIVPFILTYVYHFEGSVLFFFATVGIGELISCAVLGMPLLFTLQKYAKYLFRSY